MGEWEDRAERDAWDAAVMRRICEGDDAAVGDLYDRYASMALGLALKIVRDLREAEDIVHDAFVAVVERAEQFRPERGSVAAWLATTVRNLALDRLRRRARRERITEQELAAEREEPAPDPELLVWIERERHAVRVALERLPPPQRLVLERAFFDGLTYPEIAEAEGIPLGTVKSRMARALAALRDLLASRLDIPVSPGSPVSLAE